MTSLKALTLLILAVFLAAAGTAHAQKQELPQVTEDGLHLVPDSKLAIVYAEPGADLVPYKRVKLLDPLISFKKNWERSQRSTSVNRISTVDMGKIKTTMAKEFLAVFTSELEKAGYPVVDEVADDVLLIRPAIVNLNPNAPDVPQASIQRTYASSAGDMTLYLELYDSATSDLIAKALDKKVDGRNDGFYTWTTSASNKAAAERILKGWATILIEALNEAKQ